MYSSAPRTATRCCRIASRSVNPTQARSLRPIPSTVLDRRRRPSRRWQSTEAATSPKISGIVDQISQLTLLETADLVASLKVRRRARALSSLIWQIERRISMSTNELPLLVPPQHPRPLLISSCSCSIVRASSSINPGGRRR